MSIVQTIDGEYGRTRGDRDRVGSPVRRCRTLAIRQPTTTNHAVHDATGILSLAHRARSNTEQVDALLKMLEPPLLAFVGRRITNAVRAHEDTRSIVHDALVRIASRLKKCRATSDRQFMAWALAITRNVLADYWRSERLTFDSTDLEETINCAGAFTQWAAELEDSATLDDHTAYAELRAIVCSVYDTLPSDMTQLCWEHIVYGATWSESGKTLGITADAAKHRYMRAIKAIRQETFSRIRTMPEPGRARIVERLADCGWNME